MSDQQKYVCTVCGYVYDPAHGDPEHGIAPEPPSSKSPTTGPAPTAVSPRPISSPWHRNRKRLAVSGPPGRHR